MDQNSFPSNMHSQVWEKRRCNLSSTEVKYYTASHSERVHAQNGPT